MRIQLNAPIGPGTNAAITAMDEFRAESRGDMVLSNPSRVKDLPFREWGTMNLPTELHYDVKMAHSSQRNIWKSVVHSWDTKGSAEPDGGHIATTWCVTGMLASLIFLLFNVGNPIPTLLGLFIGLPILMVVTARSGRRFAQWGESAHSMDLKMVTTYHTALTDQFDALIAELAEAYADDLRKAGYQITDTITGVRGDGWTTRYTATNGTVTVTGSLSGSGSLEATEGVSEAIPEWAYLDADDFDYGTVLDMDGNPITPTGVTTKGTWA